MMSEQVASTDKKKSHRDRHSGRKADKKKSKKDAQNAVQELTDKQRNPKAFAFNSAVRAERKFRRKQDMDTKKQHIPLVDRTPIEPPPILIAVVGPPKVGKSTLINNLIKLFTRSPLTDVKGPVTIVTGKKRRITLIECNNDINSMIDLAKVADLVLLLCDASFGFEMEVFEFLNICQVHGMPRIMGILTHLDMIKSTKALKTAKKTLKHRFWTEVYSGAKLFYLSGILHGEYLRNEIKNLGRFISVMKFRPLTWRTTHSYLLGDRYEDLTNLELVRQNPKCDRNISLYGFVRGVPLNKNTSVHVAGFGDLRIHDITYLPDPCPLPEQIKKRALIEKEKLIYAPFSGIGGIVYDKDAVYVELGGSHSHAKRDEDDESNNIVTNLIDTKETLDTKMEQSEMQIFSSGAKITAKDMDDGDSSDASEDDGEEPKRLYSAGDKKPTDDLSEELSRLRGLQEEAIADSGRIRRKVVFEQSDEELSIDSDTEDEEEEEEEAIKTQPEYVTLKENDASGIHEKVNAVLKNLSTKKTFENTDDSSESDSDEEEPVLKKKKVNKSSDDELEDDLVEEEDDDEFDEREDDEFDEEEEGHDEDQESDNSEGDEDMALKWKDNLTKKAEDAFVERQKSTQNLMKLVYGVFNNKYLRAQEEAEDLQDEEEEEEALGGLFTVVSQQQQKLKIERDQMDLAESSLYKPWNANIRNWLEPENKSLITNCFVTGNWKESEDASELLKLDDMDDLSDADSEMFGDFEDLETGRKFAGTEKPEKRKRSEDEAAETSESREALAEKKRKLKEKFDSEYDNGEKSTYYDDLKTSAEKQAQLNRAVFENMPDEMRVQIEGYRPGMYVRMEFQSVPCEFIRNFDPTYPIVIGALNMGEENIGYVNVKIKKHRWYKRILKANDPLIISLGWRRFQTMPLYSKLEDDMKCRYLKYTPEHISCSAHFWGPITPQGTGFLALQRCEGNPEVSMVCFCNEIHLYDEPSIYIYGSDSSADVAAVINLY